MSLERIGVHSKPNPTRWVCQVCWVRALSEGPRQLCRACTSTGWTRHLAARATCNHVRPGCTPGARITPPRAHAGAGRKTFKPVFTEDALDWKIHRAAQTPGPGAAGRALILLPARQRAVHLLTG